MIRSIASGYLSNPLHLKWKETEGTRIIRNGKEWKNTSVEHNKIKHSLVKKKAHGAFRSVQSTNRLSTKTQTYGYICYEGYDDI